MLAGRRRLNVLARLWHVGGWLCLMPLVVIAGARVVAWDSRSILVGLNALTPLLFLTTALAIGVIATACRRWVLASAATLLMAANLSFALPEVLAAEGVPTAASSAPSFRIFNANVFAANDRTADFAEEIRRARPDVVVLQESTPRFLAALDATGVLADLPHRLTVSRSDPFAAAVMSRWPLRDDDVLSVRGRPILIRATLEFSPAPLRLFAFHAVSPVAGFRQEWVEDLDALAAAVGQENQPVIVAGDFNATWGHRGFRRVLDAGLTDAAADRGKAFKMTWPRNRRLVPPMLRIDHVMTTERLVVTWIGTGNGSGSDHRPLVADVAVT